MNRRESTDSGVNLQSRPRARRTSWRVSALDSCQFPASTHEAGLADPRSTKPALPVGFCH